MAPTKAVGLRLAPDVVAWLKHRAEADQRSLAFIVTQIVRGEIAREERAAPKPPRFKRGGTP